MLLWPLRSHRLTLLAVGALLASPLLGGCGFNYATDQVNTISAGINDREGPVDVLGAVVIAGQDNLGLFVATLVNNNLTEPTELSALEPTEQVAPSEAGEAIEIAAGGRTNLIQEGGIAVGGEFEAGNFVDVTLSFANGQVTTVNVPVVTPCHQYSPDKLTTLTLPEAAEATDDAAVEPGGEPGKYSCEQAEPVEHSGAE